MTFNQANELIRKWGQVQEWENSELADSYRRYEKALAEYDKLMIQALRHETLLRALQIVDGKGSK